jgi:hypothetical protein
MAAAAITYFEETALSAEVLSRCAKLGASQSFIADYISLKFPHRKMSQGELSKILNGLRPEDGERVNQIRAALSDAEELSKVFAPAKLVWDAPSIFVFANQFLSKPVEKRSIDEALRVIRFGL